MFRRWKSWKYLLKLLNPSRIMRWPIDNHQRLNKQVSPRRYPRDGSRCQQSHQELNTPVVTAIWSYGTDYVHAIMTPYDSCPRVNCRPLVVYTQSPTDKFQSSWTQYTTGTACVSNETRTKPEVKGVVVGLKQLAGSDYFTTLTNSRIEDKSVNLNSTNYVHECGPRKYLRIKNSL